VIQETLLLIDADGMFDGINEKQRNMVLGRVWLRDVKNDQKIATTGLGM
jgi:hypothetical protein